MQETKNYQLNQWEPTDEVRREDFNNDNAAIDAALKAVADTASGKADAAEVSTLQQSVNSQIAALSTALGSGGKTCRITSGSYTGNGKYGSGNPNKLTFDFKPLYILVAQGEGNPNALEGMPTFNSSIMVNPIPAAKSTTGCGLYLTWLSNGVSWFVNTNESNAAYGQNNTNGVVYYYVAVGISL